MDVKDIKDPAFLKDMDIPALEKLSDDIRKFLIHQLAQTGGHFASNMGIVELTIALHKVFDSPKDKLIFDVGHQGYVHKILTGRAKMFPTLRKLDGLSGFLKRDESVHDIYEAGHSSTSIAAAAGLLFAKNINQDIGHVITLIGDGAFASGTALEALNFLGHYPSKHPIIILNDNEMSISQNVGHLSKLLTNLRMKRSYRSLKRGTTKLMPKCLRPFATKIEKRLKGFLSGQNTFESLGYQYFGPLDGHNFKQLLKVLSVAKKTQKPTVIHLRTIKGKGYSFSESDQLGHWHGTPPFEIETGIPIKNTENGMRSYQYITASYLMKTAHNHEQLRVISPAMKTGAGLEEFAQTHPDKFIDTGIAEATALTMATALSLYQRPIFLSIYATFLQRAYDQLIHDLARHNASLIIGVDRAGIVGGDGETHQGIYDIPMLMHIPNMTIAHPKDGAELLGLYSYAFNQHQGPIAIRYPKSNTPYKPYELKDINPIPPSFEVITKGEKGTIIAFGEIIDELKTLIEKDKHAITLINARYLKPLDEHILNQIAFDQPIIIHEESTLSGGLGSEILRYLTEKNIAFNKIRLRGFDDAFVPQGSRVEILKRYQLDAPSLLKLIWEMADETG